MIEYYKGYKIRIYPNKVQEEILWKHINGCRFLWNYLVALHNDRHDKNEKFLSEFDMNNLIPGIREANPWMKELSIGSLQRVSRSLSYAFKRFFNKTARHPTFHSKKTSNQTFPVREDRFYIIKDYIMIPKVGMVKYAPGNYDFPFETYTHRSYKICNVRVTKTLHNNKWIVTFNIKRENQALPLNDYTMGIDLGVKKLAVVKTEKSTIVIKNINDSERMRKAIKRRKRDQRRMERKQHDWYEKTIGVDKTVYTPSRNWEKALTKLRRDYAKERNIRKDYIHKQTTRLVKYLPKQVIMEDLNVEGMKRKHNNSGDINNAGMSMFSEYMQYKCENHGIDFRRVPWNYPSTKTCSNCGRYHRNPFITTDRVFICRECGYSMDRDINAATNLMNYYK